MGTAATRRQRLPPKQVAQLADCAPEFEAWLIKTRYVDPATWDREFWPPRDMWDQFSDEFIKQRDTNANA